MRCSCDMRGDMRGDSPSALCGAPLGLHCNHIDFTDQPGLK